MITQEMRSALAHGWDLKLTHETLPSGEKQLVVTVEPRPVLPEELGKEKAAALAPFKNNFFEFADMRRVYRFDAKSQRLLGMEAYLHQPGGDVMVFEIKTIEYGQPIDPALFTLKVPDNVEWIDTGVEMLPDNEKYAAMTSPQAARAFLEACAKQNWSEAEKFVSGPIAKGIKESLGGLQIVSLGEPLQKKPGAVWLVPYEIKLKDGTVRKQDLPMRNDNPAKRYVVDGVHWLVQPAGARGRRDHVAPGRHLDDSVCRAHRGQNADRTRR